MNGRTPRERTRAAGARRIAPRVLERWLAYCTGRPASDGWRPTPAYRAIATVLLVVMGISLVRTTHGERGMPAATAFGVFWLAVVLVPLSGGWSQLSNLQVRHPYLDAAFSIPLAALLALALLPKDWPAAVLLAIAATYVALILGAAIRRQRRTTAHHTALAPSPTTAHQTADEPPRSRP